MTRPRNSEAKNPAKYLREQIAGWASICESRGYNNDNNNDNNKKKTSNTLEDEEGKKGRKKL